MITSSSMINQTLRNRFIDALRRFSDGISTVVELQVWLLSNLQTVLDSKDADAIEAANGVDADLVQLGESLIEETAFRESIEGWTSRLETITVEVPNSISSGIDEHSDSAGETMRYRWVWDFVPTTLKVQIDLHV